MTAPNQLNTEIRNLLDKEFRNRQFTASDFHDIADSLGKPHKDVSGCLHKLKQYGLLEIITSNPTGHGGFPIKTYQVIKGASFAIKSSGMKKKEACALAKSKGEKAARACRRLDRVVAGWAGAE